MALTSGLLGMISEMPATNAIARIATRAAYGRDERALGARVSATILNVLLQIGLQYWKGAKGIPTKGIGKTHRKS